MDFGALPPEINSIRMYTGAGSGSMMAAAAAWDGLATEMQSAAASYGSVVSGLTNGWSGPSSASMEGAAAPYVAWMTTTATQAEQAANQARAAAGAYEAAFLMTVPPPVVAANRSLLTSLVATNVLGQNTPAIAVTEAHYTEMWAQDAAAMYGYAGASASATQVTPFTPPPQTTNSAGTIAQGAAVAQTTGTSAGTNAATTLSQAILATPTAVQSFASPVASAVPAAAAAAAAPPSFLSTLDSFITGPLSPFSLFGLGGVPYLLGIQSYLLPQAAANLTSASEKVSKIGMGPALGGGLGPGSLASSGLGGAGSTVSTGMGRASMVGRLSVPQNWASAAPAIRSVAAVLPETGLGAAPAAIAAEGQGSLYSGMGLSGLAGRAMVGTGGSTVRFIPASGVVAPGEATTATIIVLPPDE